MMDIDMERVLHTPITDLEELKFDLVSQLSNLDKGDKVIIIVDSLGQLASKKELDDALAEKSTQDMTRAKVMKSVFRMINPHLNMKDIPLIRKKLIQRKLYQVVLACILLLMIFGSWVVGKIKLIPLSSVMIL
jgi:hypothetical protein